MKVLLIIPPYIPSYFNAGHHLPLFQVGAYLRANLSNASVTCVDGGALNLHWRDICSLLTDQPDVIGLMNDFDAIDNFERFTNYSRELVPGVKLFTFGRLSHQIGEFFQRYNLDAIVVNGDYEAAAADYLRFLSNETGEVGGAILRRGDGTYTAPTPGTYLQPEDWVLPDIDEIPYDSYNRMYIDDRNKFCGIPDRRELVVPVARGCPVNCAYCDVPAMQGLKERRLPIDRVVDFIETSFKRRSFDYVSFYAPTFTLKRNWILNLCDRLIALGSPYPWKCVTTIHHLDSQLIEVMAKGGCVRVSVGLEALDADGQSSLPMIKQNTQQKFLEISNSCADYGVELNCFVMLGLPGGSVDGVRQTIEAVLNQRNTRVRPTVHTPYYEMRSSFSPLEVSRYNRQLFADERMPLPIRQQYYSLLYNNTRDRVTKVMDRISDSTLES